MLYQIAKTVSLDKAGLLVLYKKSFELHYCPSKLVLPLQLFNDLI